MFETVLRSLLLEGAGRSAERWEEAGRGAWAKTRAGSPGNLSAFEDILFRSADMEAAPVLLALRLKPSAAGRVVRAPSPHAGGSLGVVFGASTGRAAAPPPCAHMGSGGASAAPGGAPPQVGVAYLDAVGRQLGAAEFTDDEASCPGF